MPTPELLTTLLDELLAAGVEFVVVGGNPDGQWTLATSGSTDAH